LQGNEVGDALVLRGARGVGDRGFRLLVDAFGSAGVVLAAPPEAVRSTCGDSEEVIRALGQVPASRAARVEEVRRATAAGFPLVPHGDPHYPNLLAQISAPPVLSLAGSLEPEEEFSVAVVGSRRASTAVCRFARPLARDPAAAGVTVVGGLARGSTLQPPGRPRGRGRDPGCVRGRTGCDLSRLERRVGRRRAAGGRLAQ